MGPSVTIQRLRDTFAVMGPGSIQITSNTILTAVVTADETSGQLYKEVYVRDYSGTYAFPGNKFYGAISLHFLNGTGGILYQGDSIAINLNGAWLDLSGGGSFQIDSLPHATYPVIQRLKSGLNPQPIIATIPQIYTYTTVPGLAAKQFVYDAQLVQINNVEFIQPEVGTTFATPQSYSVNVSSTPPVNVNKYITDFTNTIVAYNSGYSNFAGQTIPNNSGNILAISNLYTSMQLSIRSYADMSWTNIATTPYAASYVPMVYDTITQNFANMGLSKNSTCDNMAGWQTFDLQGSLYWDGTQYGNYPNWKYSPSASNYKTNNVRNDLWLVSPPIQDANYWHSAGYSKLIDFSTGLSYGTSSKLLTVWVAPCNSLNDVPTASNLNTFAWQNISSAFPNIVVGSSASGIPNHYAASPQPHGIFSPNPLAISVGTSTTTPAPYFYIAFRYQSNTNYVDSTGATYILGTLVLKDN